MRWRRTPPGLIDESIRAGEMPRGCFCVSRYAILGMVWCISLPPDLDSSSCPLSAKMRLKICTEVVPTTFSLFIA